MLCAGSARPRVNGTSGHDGGSGLEGVNILKIKPISLSADAPDRRCSSIRRGQLSSRQLVYQPHCAQKDSRRAEFDP